MKVIFLEDLSLNNNPLHYIEFLIGIPSFEKDKYIQSKKLQVLSYISLVSFFKYQHNLLHSECVSYKQIKPLLMKLLEIIYFKQKQSVCIDTFSLGYDIIEKLFDYIKSKEKEYGLESFIIINDSFLSTPIENAIEYDRKIDPVYKTGRYLLEIGKKNWTVVDRRIKNEYKK